MNMQGIAAAVKRARAVFQRRPEQGLHDDAPATACWRGGTRFVTSHPNGACLTTDLPSEFGGSGDQVTPGWPFRAGIAACAATSIVLVAATEGVEPASLDVRVASRSDARGMLGMDDDAGGRVACVPLQMRLQVRIAATGVSDERLRALVDEGLRRSRNWRAKRAPRARCSPSASSNWSATRRSSTSRSGGCCSPPTC